MSRFPLTRTPAQAAMLARCLFGGSITDTGAPREDGDSLETADTHGTGADETRDAPARPRMPRLWCHQPPTIA